MEITSLRNKIHNWDISCGIYCKICDCIIPQSRERKNKWSNKTDHPKSARRLVEKDSRPLLDPGLRNARSAFRVSVPSENTFSPFYTVPDYNFVLHSCRNTAAAASSQPRAKRDFGFCEKRVFTEQTSTISHSHRDSVRNNEVRASSAMSVIVGSERHVCICMLCVWHTYGILLNTRYSRIFISMNRIKLVQENYEWSRNDVYR